MKRKASVAQRVELKAEKERQAQIKQEAKDWKARQIAIRDKEV